MAKATTSKTKTMKEDIEITKEEVAKEAETSVKKAPKTFNATDTIPCISCTAGELVMIGKKSQTKYIWADYGDVSEVEYQDLYSAKISKSAFIFLPTFFIEDEELLEDPKWSDVKKLYEDIYSKDINELFDLNSSELERVLVALPKGLQTAFKNVAASKIEEGSLDSVAKIKAIDTVLGTDLLTCLIK